MRIEDSRFEEIVARAIDGIPEPYKSRVNNIAFLIEDEPSIEQRQQLNLHGGETLFGLYEGVPLPQRGGSIKILPDRITVFKRPLLWVSQDEQDLEEKIGRTIWHEVAHYFGLNHERIHEIENKRKQN